MGMTIPQVRRALKAAGIVPGDNVQHVPGYQTFRDSWAGVFVGPAGAEPGSPADRALRSAIVHAIAQCGVVARPYGGGYYV